MAAITHREPTRGPREQLLSLRTSWRRTSRPAARPAAGHHDSLAASALRSRRRASGSRPHERLTPLDAAFYALESPRAPMHLGWAAVFSPPSQKSRPSFDAISAHIERRLGRAPRYRQRLLEVPFGLAEPLWADDEAFDITRHVRRAWTSNLGELVDGVMSAPLDPARPLWELWVAERLDDGRVGVVGKAHHALVDGLAAVELMALLLDPGPEPQHDVPTEWRPATTPSSAELVGGALRDRAARTLAGSRRALDLAKVRGWAPDLVHRALGCARTVAHAALPPAPRSRLNGQTTSDRHLAWSSRPLRDLELIERRFNTTINDILLAASAGAVRDVVLAREEGAERLKAMVPVSVRAPGERWGNRIAFVFPGLPCDEADAVRRLRDVHAAMCARKRGHEAEAADIILRTLGRAPRPVRKLAARLLTSPRLSNVTISNVPGPPVPLYLMGCRAEQAYPVVPLTAGHGISIGLTSVSGSACFGVYADGTRAEDADRLALAIGESIDELVGRCGEARLAPELVRPGAITRTSRSRRRGQDLAA